jgi:DNA-binding transcriptional MocR family regulator
MSTAIARYFPSDTRITSPKGGFVLWVELNSKVDGLIVYREARKKKIAIFPGVIFSISQQYRNYIRISCGLQWTQQTEEGVKMLGEIIKQQMCDGRKLDR